MPCYAPNGPVVKWTTNTNVCNNLTLFVTVIFFITLVLHAARFYIFIVFMFYKRDEIVYSHYKHP